MFCIPVRLWPSFPTNLLLPHEEKGSPVILMAETGDGTQGLAKKSTPVRCTRYPRGAEHAAFSSSQSLCAASQR
jgi:hypothetical protein